MNIVATSSSANISSDPSEAGDIGKLQKRLQVLMKELKNIANENLSPKDKEEKTKLLQAEIGLIQAQIAAIQRQQAEASERKAEASAAAPQNQKTVPHHTKKNTVNIGLQVDTYA